MKALIVDDEIHNSESLLLILERYCTDIDEMKVANDPLTGLELIKTFRPDVLFLDIEMPHMSGFELLANVDEISFEIIFTTAYNEYAIQAFKVNAVDYLLKPISKDDLLEAVKRAKKRRQGTSDSKSIDLLLKQLGVEQPGKTKIALASMEGLDFVDITKIIRCEADSNYTHIILEGNKRMTVTKTLKELEELLSGHSFMRVHHSHLVNLEKISRYERGSGGYVIMDNGNRVQVSRSKKADFLKRLGLS